MDPMDFTSLFAFQTFLIFCRLGGAIMAFPGFSDISVNVRTRLHLAVLVSLLMLPALTTKLPTLPTQNSELIAMIFIEILIGTLLLLGARMMMASLQFAGDMIGFLAGFQTANLFDPSSGANTSAPGVLLTLVVTTLIFVTNVHHMVFQSVFESYDVFPAGEMLPLNDGLVVMLLLVAKVFIIGLKIAAPMVVMGFLVYIAFGIFNRLIPQLQVFFVALPINIATGMIMLALALGLILTVFMEAFMENAVFFNIE